MKLLIAVMTCEKYAHRANALRQTWVQDAVAQPWMTVKFFRGNLASDLLPELSTDEIYLDVDDGYLGLPAKVQAACKWALAEGYDYIFKTDDDVFVNLAILGKLKFGIYDYVGRFRGPSGGYPADYASGFGYFLSREAMRHVVEADLTPDWAEDRWIGNLLASKGISGYAYGNNYFAPVAPPLKPGVIWRTNVRNAAVFCEFPTVAELEEMYRLKHQASTAYIPAEPNKVLQTVRVMPAHLTRYPTDQPDGRDKVQGRAPQASNDEVNPSSSHLDRLTRAAQEKGGPLTQAERNRAIAGDEEVIRMKTCPVCGGEGKVRAH